jgi:hypothetical protein
MSDYDPNIALLREMLALSILSKLDECEFELLDNPRKTLGLSRPELAERVYVRNIDDKGRLKVKVFTSVVGGAKDVPLGVRAEGKDAIRVCATYTTNDGKERGLVKETRINRTGNIEDIVDRMHQRMRSAWKSASGAQKCYKCGAPKFTTKKGNLCCAEVCWKTPEEKVQDEAAFKRNNRRARRRRYY